MPEVPQTSSMILAGIWLTRVDVWQKPTQYCKAIILQVEINLKKHKNTYKKNNTNGSYHLLEVFLDQGSFHFIFSKPYGAGAIIIPILQMRN